MHKTWPWFLHRHLLISSHRLAKCVIEVVVICISIFRLFTITSVMMKLTSYFLSQGSKLPPSVMMSARIES